MSKHTHLLSKPLASEDIAWKKTNSGFHKQLEVKSSQCSTGASHSGTTSTQDCAKGKGHLSLVQPNKKKTDAELRKTAVGSVVMVTVGLDKRGGMNQQLAVSKGPGGEELQFQQDMSKSNIDIYLRSLFL
ncbi:hypothetical protein PAXRUDRAFT_16217 [Paxillus rubicundulus Ve08.2h10]|uniref:Uncharacterized protein n=1 Tax=Paxillus rubicundulus Ve08.2h10 TaxID=930991 RepID=A0A0D0DMJ0_9AGAM|nr:hypothetical protein PAXRUDRAFT_16217 [Paxillus rubicundulus Ve08.2h10]